MQLSIKYKTACRKKFLKMVGDDMTEHIFNRKSASIILKAKFETGKNKKNISLKKTFQK